MQVDTGGILSTFAGTCCTYDATGKPVTSFKGDGGPAQTAGLNFPVGVTISPAGDVYIADTFNNAIRKVCVMGLYFCAYFWAYVMCVLMCVLMCRYVCVHSCVYMSEL